MLLLLFRLGTHLVAIRKRMIVNGRSSLMDAPRKLAVRRSYRVLLDRLRYTCALLDGTRDPQWNRNTVLTIETLAEYTYNVHESTWGNTVAEVPHVAAMGPTVAMSTYCSHMAHWEA